MFSIIFILLLYFVLIIVEVIYQWHHHELLYYITLASKEREDQIRWAENIISASGPDADLSTLRIYIDWLKVPDVPKPV